ncbi:MAG: hypothetical protein JWL77_6305 [Chthonomonadaceae bacterium]|nr:hypothetical protein [Chthonomonadaceae bacterium]
MWLAITKTYEPRWSEEIHAEWIRNVLEDRPDVTSAQLERTRRRWMTLIQRAWYMDMKHGFRNYPYRILTTAMFWLQPLKLGQPSSSHSIFRISLNAYCQHMGSVLFLRMPSLDTWLC